MDDKSIHKFTTLVAKVIERLAEIWDSGEGSLEVKVTDEGGIKKAKIGGGKVERV